MSLLSDFANSAYTTASAVIGTKTIAIAGGTAVACVVNETRHSRDFEEGGMALDWSMEAVIKTSVFKAAYTSAASAYVGLLAVVGGVTYRVASVSAGVSTTSIGLANEEDA